MKNLLILLFFFAYSIFNAQDSIKRNVFVFQFGAVIPAYQSNGASPSYNAVFNVGARGKRCFLVQTGLEYSRSQYQIDNLYTGKFGNTTNNHFAFHQFSIPLYFNFISKKEKLLIGGGPLIDLVTTEIHNYDDYSYDPFTLVTTVNKNQKTTTTEPTPGFFTMCLKTDYNLKIKKSGIVFGLRGYLPLYAFNFDDSETFWNIRVTINAGIMF